MEPNHVKNATSLVYAIVTFRPLYLEFNFSDKCPISAYTVTLPLVSNERISPLNHQMKVLKQKAIVEKSTIAEIEEQMLLTIITFPARAATD